MKFIVSHWLIYSGLKSPDKFPENFLTLCQQNKARFFRYGEKFKNP